MPLLVTLNFSTTIFSPARSAPAHTAQKHTAPMSPVLNSFVSFQRCSIVRHVAPVQSSLVRSFGLASSNSLVRFFCLMDSFRSSRSREILESQWINGPMRRHTFHPQATALLFDIALLLASSNLGRAADPFQARSAQHNNSVPASRANDSHKPSQPQVDVALPTAAMRTAEEVSSVSSNQSPASTAINQINTWIQTNLDALKSSEGKEVGGKKVFLTDGRDFISFDDYNPADKTEWCLFKQGGNVYNLVTAETAKTLTDRGQNPLTREVLKEGDVVQGQAMLDLLQAKSALPHEAPHQNSPSISAR